MHSVSLSLLYILILELIKMRTRYVIPDYRSTADSDLQFMSRLMRLIRRFLGKAKQHFFMDANMSEVVDPVGEKEFKCGCGTKVVVTIGPATHSVDTMIKLLENGMACARMDLTWGTVEYHRSSLKNLAAAMKATRRLCGVWIDTSGREIVIQRPTKIDSSGWVEIDKAPIEFKKGSEVVITTRDVGDASSSVLPVRMSSFPSLIRPGQYLQVSRYMSTGVEGGSLFLEVKSVSETDVKCVATNDASLVGLLIALVSHREFELTSHSQDLNTELPLMAEHEINDLKTLGKEFEIDYISLSYCNSAADVREAREILDSIGMEQTKIIAKVERKAAIHNYEDIINIADGILFSRGNLGLDFEPEEMAHLQKKCILRCNAIARPIILTRFVDTMVNTPRPTRAEATDVANAVLDGVDGVMLGAETLRGLYPIETLQTVSKLCSAAEKYFDYRTHHEDLMGEAFEEEIGLDRSFYSTSDLGRLDHENLVRMRSLHPIDIAPLDAKKSDENDFGSPSNIGGFSPGTGTKTSSFGMLPLVRGNSSEALSRIEDFGAPYMSKMESIASSAVRTAEKINAGLIIVFAQTGRTVSLVAKYRPPMPVLSVVVPTLESNRLGWRLEGKYLARQCLIMRGVRPIMAAPMSSGGSSLLNEAVATACDEGLVDPQAYVVAILSEHGNFVVKVVKIDRDGSGIIPSAVEDGDMVGYASGAAETFGRLSRLSSLVSPPVSPTSN